ncbi:hypothetical protein HanIR_Chr12g0613301 [Helianthus annuus]|nr:hypothetical protein HanIR_Chr12g0613301 [Helianthus annuus]
MTRGSSSWSQTLTYNKSTKLKVNPRPKSMHERVETITKSWGSQV